VLATLTRLPIPVLRTDVLAVMDSTSIVWSDEEKQEFISCLPACFKETFRCGRINESFFEEQGFPIDTDAKGNEYPLTSDADHRSRSFPVYHKAEIKRRKDLIEEEIRKKEIQQEIILEQGKQLLVDNELCEQKLQGDKNISLNSLSLLDFEK
jgi:hypothetical protein